MCPRQSPPVHILVLDRPREVFDESTIAVVASESLPQIEAHVDGVVVAEVSIRNNGGSRDTVVLHSDRLAAKGIMLGLAVFVKNIRRHGDERFLWINIREKGADAACTAGPEDVVACGCRAISVNRAVGAGTRSSFGDLFSRGCRYTEREDEYGDKACKKHFEDGAEEAKRNCVVVFDVIANVIVEFLLLTDKTKSKICQFSGSLLIIYN